VELTGRLLRWGAMRPHLLLAEVPGSTGVRLAVEAYARQSEWPLALSPADADVLVVCGRQHGALADAVDTTWRAISEPRARLELSTPVGLSAELARAVAELSSVALQRDGAAHREPAAAGEQAAEQSHGDMDMSGAHGGMETDRGSGMGMSLPGGLVMADRAQDRDGLMLDVLHLRLGPVLPCWPAGLALDVVLQGDVVQEAEVVTYDVPDASSYWLAPGAHDGALPVPAHLHRRTAARRLDAAARLLQLAGWTAGADQARRLRDALLEPSSDRLPDAAVSALARRVRRSRSLRWALRDLGAVPPEAADGLGRIAGDAHDRLLSWLDEAEREVGGDAAAVSPGQARRDGDDSGAALRRLLPGLVTGLDVAGARLVVASLDLEVLPAPRPAEVARG